MEVDDTNNKKNRVRSANFSYHETTTLVNIILKFGDIIENKRTDAITWREKKEAWNKITSEFNAEVGLLNRSTKVLQTKYESLKRQLKRKHILNKTEKQKTGGGFPKLLKYTDYEEKLRAIFSLSIEGLPSRYDSDKENLPDVTNEQIDAKDHNISILLEDAPIICDLDAATTSMATFTADDNMELLTITPLDVGENGEECTSPIQTQKRKWVNWKPTEIKQPPTSKLLPNIKSKAKKSQLSDKYSSLADMRCEMVKLQIEVAKKELELKQKQLEFCINEEARKEREHQSTMQLLELQKDQYNN